MSALLTIAMAITFGQLEDTRPAALEADRFRAHVSYLASDELEGRGPASEGAAKAAEYIVEQVRAAGLSPLGDEGTFYQAFPWKKQSARNVVAVFPGAGELADEAVILCAHYDHLGIDPERIARGEDGIFNGANDDAAGVAALLQIAEALKAEAGELPSSRRSVVILFVDLEEVGLVGSGYYVEHPRWPLEKTTAVVCLDGMGHPRAGKVFAADAACAPVLQKRLETLSEKCGLRIETRLSGVRRNDYVHFFDRQIPAFMIFTGLTADYHKVSDEVDKLDCHGAARIAWLTYRFVVETIADPEPIVFQKTSPTYDLQVLLRVVTKLGMYPKMGAQSGRYPQLGFIKPGSTADKSSLRAGDEIVALNGVTFERFEDALVIWPQLQLDEGLHLSLLRDGKPAETTLPAEAFRTLAGPPVKPLGDGRFEVTFKYRPKEPAEAVYLAGTFNDWKPTAHKMDGPDAEGRFATRLVLEKGSYEYKFVVEGKKWETDPENALRAGLYQNSVLSVGVEP